MIDKKKKTIPTDASNLTHNPFAHLAKNKDLLAKLAPAVAPPVAKAAPPGKPLPRLRIRFHLETKGRSGKVVTRITGLPRENLEPIASRMRKALGCGATLEGEDLLLLGSLEDRAAEWIEKAGDLRSIRDEPPKASPAPASPLGPAAPYPGSAHRAPTQGPAGAGFPPSTHAAGGSARGTERSAIHRGSRVAIVLKADQPTGTLTEGIVRDILTNSENHPRGIKVRLETGEIGRVRVIF